MICSGSYRKINTQNFQKFSLRFSYLFLNFLNFFKKIDWKFEHNFLKSNVIFFLRVSAGDLSSGLSSCSITSGTPSTDVRFSEFHLDKVTSYLTPSDEDIIFNVRPTRAYSTGSKPDAGHNKFVRWVNWEFKRFCISLFNKKVLLRVVGQSVVRQRGMMWRIYTKANGVVPRLSPGVPGSIPNVVNFFLFSNFSWGPTLKFFFLRVTYEKFLE